MAKPSRGSGNGVGVRRQLLPGLRLARALPVAPGRRAEESEAPPADAVDRFAAKVWRHDAADPVHSKIAAALTARIRQTAGIV